VSPPYASRAISFVLIGGIVAASQSVPTPVLNETRGSFVFTMAVIAPLMGSEFVNAEDRGQFVVEAELPAGTSLTESSRLSDKAERILLKNPEIKVLSATVGVDGEPNKVRWRVVVTPKMERSVNLLAIKDSGRIAAQTITGARVSVTDPAFVEGAATEAPIMIRARHRIPRNRRRCEQDREDPVTQR
jgi:multidrug efflux pump subunit AcrB